MNTVTHTVLSELEEGWRDGAAQSVSIGHFSQWSQTLCCGAPHHWGVILGQSLKYPPNDLSLYVSRQGVCCGQQSTGRYAGSEPLAHSQSLQDIQGMRGIQGTVFSIAKDKL